MVKLGIKVFDQLFRHLLCQRATRIKHRPQQTFDFNLAIEACFDALQGVDEVAARATEELDIPIEPLRIGGEDCYVLLMSGKSAEDLRLDPDYREAQAGFGKGESPLVKRGFGKFGMIIPVIYPKMPSPVNPNVAAGAAGNLSRALLLGKSALQFAKVSPWEFFENDADDAKRRTAISIGSMMGMTPTLFNGVRRNALAIDHYVR